MTKFIMDVNTKKLLTLQHKTGRQLQRKLMIANIRIAEAMVKQAQEQIKPSNAVLVAEQPFRNQTGNARRNTKYSLTPQTITIQGNTPYYSFLEDGTIYHPPYPTIKIAVRDNLAYLLRLSEETMKNFFVKYE